MAFNAFGTVRDRVVQHFVEICGFCDLRPGTPKKFKDLRLLNESKNLKICDLQISKKSLLAHL